MADGQDGRPIDEFWQSVFKAHMNRGKAERTEWGELSRMYRGGAKSGGDYERNGLVEDDATSVPNSYMYAFADTLAANVVPSNPAVTIKSNRQILDQAARFRSKLCNLIFTKDRLAEKLWAMTTRTAVWGRCWLKVVYSKNAKRPTFRVVDPHYIWADLDAENEEDMNYVIEVTVITKGEFERRVKRKGSREKQFYPSDIMDKMEFGSYPDWIAPESSETGTTAGTGEQIVRESYEYCVIFEVYDFVRKRFYHYANGIKEALYEGDLPYVYQKNPFKLLVFNDNMQDLGGLSDAALIKDYVKRMQELDELEMTHIKTSIPSLILHGGLVENVEDLMEALQMADGPGLVIEAAIQQGVSVNEVLAQTPVVQLPIEWQRSRGGVEEKAQFTLGLPSYMRGEVGQADVATELALSDTATRTRNARRQKVIYNVIEWCAKATIALYIQFFQDEEAGLSEIPLRILDGGEEAVVTASMMAMEQGDDPWTWDYTAHPYTAAEANEIVQLKQLETYLPVLMGNPAVDQTKLIKHLLTLLHAPDLAAQPQMAPPQMAAPGGAPMGAGGGEAVQGMPPEMMPNVQGGEVMQGNGAQAVPGGLEGGNQPGGGTLNQL